MGGKGGGRSGYDQNAINQAAYQAGAGGQRWNDVTLQVPTGHDQAQQSWMAGRSSMGGGAHAGKPYDFFADAMGKMHAPDGGGGSYDFDAQMSAQADMLAQQEAERARIQGENQRDALYGQYMDSAGTATDYINKQIADEASNARLLGIDYSVTDEQKSQRIGDYFASIWGQGQQSQLEALMGKWGNPQGFDGWTVTRGDASKIKGGQAGEEQVTAGKGQKPTIIDPEADEEAVLGGGAALLGG